MSFQKILVALDNSDESEYVFNQALDLAKAEGAELMLFHCLAIAIGETIVPIQAELGISPNLANDAYQARRLSQEKHREEMLAKLGSYSDTATSQAVKTEYHHQSGEPGSSICEFSQKWGADLIVLGRRGRSGFTEALLGSASNYVMHNARCSVLVIQNH